MRTPQFQTVMIPGPVGILETLVLPPIDEANPKGIALVAHPNPVQGGTNTNKVVQTLAKTFSRQGFVSYLPNLRGVGMSEGVHDFGHAEVDDMGAVLAYARSINGHLPLLLSGFSFGTYVQSQLRQRLEDHEVAHMILVGPACSRFDLPTVPASTLIVHGEEDEVVPLFSVFDWARPQSLPVVVVPGVGHFFHGKLALLSDTVTRLIPW